MDKKRIEVVAGLWWKGDRLFLTQRLPTDGTYAFLWESPGGKVEPGEHHIDALAREWREELGIDPCVSSTLVFAASIDDPPCGRNPIAIYFYEVVLPDDAVPQLTEACGFGWFTVSEMEDLPLMPGNWRLHDHLVRSPR